ncbi:MAG: hypothetical protein NVS1B4_20090 [Gemmatimonadaceae bacterium]
MEKGALLRPDVYEGGLDAGKDGVHPAEVYVADHAACFRTVDEELNKLIVLQNRDPRFALGRIDENFSFHRLAAPLWDAPCGRSVRSRVPIEG